jgi:hypothetical protein
LHINNDGISNRYLCGQRSRSAPGKQASAEEIWYHYVHRAGGALPARSNEQLHAVPALEVVRKADTIVMHSYKCDTNCGEHEYLRN